MAIGTLRKPRRQRQRERGKTKGLMRRTMALHVHYKTLYIYQPFFAKQQREITTFCVSKATRVPTANFSYFCWKMTPSFTYSFILTLLGRLNTSSHSRNSFCKRNTSSFFNRRFPRRRRRRCVNSPQSRIQRAHGIIVKYSLS